MGNAVVHFEVGAAADGPLVAFYGAALYGSVDDHMRTGEFRDPAGNVFGIFHY